MRGRALAAALHFAGVSIGGLTFAASLSMPAFATEAPVIQWRVENPFPFFTQATDTAVHLATYESLSSAERLAPVLSAERALSRRHEDGWAASMYSNTCWNSKKNAYGCKAYDDYINPKSHKIIAEISGLEESSLLTCTWLTAPKDGDIVRGEAVTQPCTEKVQFEVPYPAGSTIKVEIGGIKVVEVDAKPRDILVVGMGDSFASGEGNPDIAVRLSRDRSADYGTIGGDGTLAGYPVRIGDWKSIGDQAFIQENARWLDQSCHRSLYSHQLRAALQLSVEDPHRAVTFVGLSCSGAEIVDGLFLRYKGNEWTPNPPDMSQISAAAQSQCGKNDAPSQDLPEAYHLKGAVPELTGGLVLRKCRGEDARKIDLVMLSIGGNDIGFSRLVGNAVLSSESTLRMLGGWLGDIHGQAAAETQMKALDPRYKSLNRALHNILHIPWEESDRIILASYPGMALTGDGSETCSDGRAGLEVVPDFVLSQSKLKEGIWIGDKLHRAMRDDADDNGWTFVETHRRQFVGRGICSGGTYDGGNPADDLRLPRKIDDVWQPYNPADFRAYSTRQRWFRTPNDAFLTGNFHVAASLLQKVTKIQAFSWFQLLLAATYSGAFHPTAEGNAAMADAVVNKARIVLDKYGQGRDREPLPIVVEAAPPVDEPGPIPMPGDPIPVDAENEPGLTPPPTLAAPADAAPLDPANAARATGLTAKDARSAQNPSNAPASELEPPPAAGAVVREELGESNAQTGTEVPANEGQRRTRIW